VVTLTATDIFIDKLRSPNYTILSIVGGASHPRHSTRALPLPNVIG